MAEENSPVTSQHSKKHAPALTHFQGHWCLSQLVPNVISFQKHFQALDDDIVLASKPKTGTTWLKSLAFSIMNRNRFTLSDSPLNSSNPHDLVPYFEMTLYKDGQIPDFADVSSPRLFSTHLPYQALAESIKQSNSRIVYIARNPLDVIVSLWHFITSKPERADWTLEECFEQFCRGEEAYGPFWDHVLRYWKESSEKPNKVLFLKYEDMKENAKPHIRKMAEFMGFPFSVEEETAGVIEEIAKFCSLSNLKDLEVNKTGTLAASPRQTKPFFRKGEVGDYVNYLSNSAVERFCKIFDEKLSGSGLTFRMSLSG
ncbi:LOW QUALITY PROTEIN: cytosolic sulfotransferase 14-like [Herrania umbratica]|uniref:Sulfotransferase n=1 Tax=Herrania umbratica TaxID=108875 RepID=A0A6J1BNU9_9ROSI|nr:LOW QUALITY PROTEIN: cytosolic sulfotransferase 14-like [Herrania umbratica]